MDSSFYQGRQRVSVQWRTGSSQKPKENKGFPDIASNGSRMDFVVCGRKNVYYNIVKGFM